jgi:DivIVA domain-containing protein
MWKVSKENGEYTLKLKEVLSWQQIYDIEKIVAQENSDSEEYIEVRAPQSIQGLLKHLESKTFKTVGWRSKEGYDLDEVDDFLDDFQVKLIQIFKDLGQITVASEKPARQLESSDKPQIVQQQSIEPQSAETQLESATQEVPKITEKGASDGNNH